MNPAMPDAQPPAKLFGTLFAAVQERGLFADSKSFADATPKRAIEAIMADFAWLGDDDDALRRFVSANFDLPPTIAPAPSGQPAQPLRDYIRATWASLARAPEPATQGGSALAVGHRHIVPGGRFRELYYWDSYFTLLGLLRDGERALAEGIVDAMTELIETYGYVPNGTRSYYLGRSQPPLYHRMVALLDDRRPAVAARRFATMKREYGWWMRGAGTLAPGGETRRVVMLADGSVLNRYWDPSETPRDESWREDHATARASDRPPGDVWRELRAGAESGWDFSSRWLASADLASIRTTRIVPIDLNALLFGLETALGNSGEGDARDFAARAERRRAAMTRHLWNEAAGYFGDFDLDSGALRAAPTAAAFAPLFTGAATQAQADATARLTRDGFLAPGGLRTSLQRSGQQWDSPNGWAPLQWIAVSGLQKYGHGALAAEIARRWITTVDLAYRSTGLVHEKYDIETQSVGEGGEYAPQVGFGWTSGVTADLIDQGFQASLPCRTI